MDSVRSSPPAGISVSLRFSPRFGSRRPFCGGLPEHASSQSTIVRTLCSGSLNDAGSQIAGARTVSANGSSRPVLIGAVATDGLFNSAWMPSHVLSRSTGFSAGISLLQAANASFIATTRSGLLLSCSLDPPDDCALNSCIGGRMGGNVKSPANCELFGITVADNTVTESALCVRRSARACASRCDDIGTCMKERESRELKLVDGDDEDRG